MTMMITATSGKSSDIADSILAVITDQNANEKVVALLCDNINATFVVNDE